MFSYSRLHRLVSKQQFNTVFAEGQKVQRKNLIVLYCRNNQLYSRLGIILNKRHMRHAVDRNLFRRVIRESFRYQKESLKGLDIIVLVRAAWINKDKRILRNDIDHLWQALVDLPKSVS